MKGKAFYELILEKIDTISNANDNILDSLKNLFIKKKYFKERR